MTNDRSQQNIVTDGLIFDLDGTLWDASPACALAWNAAFTDIGLQDMSVDERLIRSISGLKLDVILQDHFTMIPPQSHGDLRAAYEVQELKFMKEQGGELYPGVAATITQLSADFRLFIVSNCLSGYIENFLSLHQLENYFTDFECYGNTRQPKDHNIRMIADRNGLRAPVYIGDTSWDAVAAKDAGLPFIHAAYGFGNEASYDYAIHRIDELVKICKQS